MNMSFVIMAITVIVAIVVIVIIALVIYEVYNRLAEKCRQEAMQYLLRTAEGFYFYGCPLAKCIESGVVWNLGIYSREIGDFARPFGRLVLCAMSNHGDQSAKIYEQCCIDPSGYEYSKVYVTFKYRSKVWAYRVQAPRLDECSFRQVKQQNELGAGYVHQDYWKLSRMERYMFEKCAIAEHSDLEPSIQYLPNNDDLEGTVRFIVRIVALK